MVKEIEPFFGRKKDNRAIKIEWLDSKHSGQEQPRGIRLIIDILPVQHQSIGTRSIY